MILLSSLYRSSQRLPAIDGGPDRGRYILSHKSTRVVSCPWLGGFFTKQTLLDVRQEFVEHYAKCSFCYLERSAFKSEAGAAVWGRKIQIRYASCRKASENYGESRLPLPIVSLRAYRRTQGIPEPLAEAAGPHAIVSRVLVQDNWEDRAAKHVAVECVGILSAKSFPISLDSLPVLWKAVVSLPDACDK